MPIDCSHIRLIIVIMRIFKYLLLWAVHLVGSAFEATFIFMS